MADEIEYEGLSGDHSLAAHMAAGATAGYFEHICVYPFDVVRTRMQSTRLGCAPKSNNPFVEIRRLIHFEGLRPLVRGSGAVFVGCGPAHAMQYACYEKTKSALESRNFSFASSVGGAVGSICHDLWMNPADVVKQRLQLQGSPYISQSYSSIVRSIYQTEGLFAFYVSFPTQILMNVPFSFIQFGIYEKTKSILNPENTYSPITNAICGGVAGGVAAYVTTPLDVIKTVLNTQEGLTSGACSPCSAECGPKSEYISNIQEACEKIKATHPNNPISPFFRGCWARVAAAAPGCALSWIAYEFMKTFFNAGNSQDKLDKVGHLSTVENLNERKKSVNIFG